MFGQEPRLPVDFLLGRVEEPVCGKVNEWVQEHQSGLREAFEGARDKLRVAAERRKTHHDQHVRDVPLEEGQLVWLRDFNRRERHKIQDRWCSMVYRVVKAPTEGGSVYTIAPADDLDHIRQVHRTLLKAVVRAAPLGRIPAPISTPPDLPPVEDDVSWDGDLLVLRPAALSAIPTPPAAVPRHIPELLPSTTDLALTLPGPSVAPATVAADLPSVHSAVPSGPCPSTSNTAARRTVRSTAGQHSNLHHLPRPLVGSVQGAANVLQPASNAVLALFRPWN